MRKGNINSMILLLKSLFLYLSPLIATKWKLIISNCTRLQNERKYFGSDIYNIYETVLIRHRKKCTSRSFLWKPVKGATADSTATDDDIRKMSSAADLLQTVCHLGPSCSQMHSCRTSGIFVRPAGSFRSQIRAHSFRVLVVTVNIVKSKFKLLCVFCFVGQLDDFILFDR